MASRPPLPTRAQILDWLAENPTRQSGRDIARAFGIRGAERLDLKRLLHELAAEGALAPRPHRARREGHLPPVAVLQVTGLDAEGELSARPLEWPGEEPVPAIRIVQIGSPAPGPGDRVLARLSALQPADGADYEARVIRTLGAATQRIVGIFRKGADGGRITPIDRRESREWRVPAGAALSARDGELVEAEQSGPRARLGLPLARITARLGDPAGPRALSLIAIHQHGIPDAFLPEVLAEAEALSPAGQQDREDLTALPFVTIDPADARDRDDAVLAQPDLDPANPGGHILWVAIADVAHYVTPGSALDAEAYERGNSTYFPDRVVPMLPERLSGDLCSLHQGEARPCLVARMAIDSSGGKRSHRFLRATIRSVASLSYSQVQAAQDGAPDAACAPLLEAVIAPLYAAYAALARARALRQPLDLDLPERRIVLSPEGAVLSVGFAQRLDAHRLIEEFMVLANVAAAEELLRRRRAAVFRVHEEPDPLKLDALREVARASGLVLAKGQVLQTRHLNRLLADAQGTEADQLINLATLRAMQQAQYQPQNLGHFGLALRAYAHFTAPIRRYADLIVHRALIAAHGWGTDGLTAAEEARLERIAGHISLTERRSMLAERDTADRYLALWLSERVGSEFPGRVSGVQSFGLFVRLDETGADGIVPIRTLGHEYYRFDAEAQTLTGRESGRVLGLGQRVLVRLAEATPMTGGLTLELLEVQGEAHRPRARPGPGVRQGARPGRPALRRRR